MPTRLWLVLALTAAGALNAQQPVAPTPEPVGSPSGTTLDDYNVTQSFETGYRFALTGGDRGMYRSVVNYGDGIRLLGSSLAVYSKDGHGHYFDSITLNTEGLGNDPYEAASLRVEKNGLYRYDMLWRLSDYFNPGLTVAGGLHLEDTSRRLQDHDLTLFPQSNIQFRLGYSRNTESGPALTTAQEFDFNGPAFPVFANVRRQWNEYRLGANVKFRGWKLTLLRRWDYYKDDTPESTFTGQSGIGQVVLPDPLTSTVPPSPVLQQFTRSQPLHGASPGWLGNLFTRRKYWGLDARMTYVSGIDNFLTDEMAAGISQFGGPANRQIFVAGDAHRPMLAGDFSLNLFPTDDLTVVNMTSITSNRIDGNSSYSEFLTGSDLGTTINFRFLGIRTVTNSTDVDYMARKWLSFYAGYHYSDRLIRTVEGFNIPAFANSAASDLYEVSNHLNSGTAGIRVRPLKPLTVNLEGEVGRANYPLTPQSEANYHTLGGRVDYRAKNLRLETAYHEHYNFNNILGSNAASHSREYNANGSWTPNSWLALDVSYSKLHIDSLTGLAFFAAPQLRPVLETAYSSLYVSNIHAANFGARFALGRRADLYAGYSITKDVGDGRPSPVPAGVTDPVAALLDSVQTFPLTYQSPMARLSIRISQKVRWNAGWQFYDYAELFHILGYNQNFRANTGYSSILWSF